MAVCSLYKRCKREFCLWPKHCPNRSIHGRSLWPVHVESVPKSWPMHDLSDHAVPDFGQQRFGPKLVEIGAFDQPNTTPLFAVQVFQALHFNSLYIVLPWPQLGENPFTLTALEP